MTTANALETLARKLLRAELAARGARDLDAAEAYVSKLVQFDPETGEHVGAVDPDGNPLIAHKRDGCPPMSLDEVLASTMKTKPDLFGGQSVPPGRIGQPPAHNPFMNGMHFNITEGMKLYRENPDHAIELAEAAGFDLRIR